jgi:WD40 repeat protein
MGCTIGSTDVGQQLKENSTQTSTKPSKYNYSYLQVRTRSDADQNVFRIYKGVKTFDFSKSKNVIITGGMDRILRIWNPYVTAKPTGTLRGHNAPITYLRITEEEDRIYSVSMDRCVKVWDIQDHNCLLTIRPKGHKIRGDIQACYYSPIAKGLAIATDQMSIISQRLKPSLQAEIPITHKAPVHCATYNSCFKQVITSCENSVVKVWDFETGEFIFEYGDAHGDNAITCMTFDNTGRRLITGGRDGSIRIWNYNNGHCLRTMQKSCGNQEICALTFIEMNKNRFIMAVGWDRRMNMYPDSLDSPVLGIQLPLPAWPDDEINGHKEDIMSIAQCAPNFLATSSYDGEVIVWNLVSGHVFCHLRSPLIADPLSNEGDRCIYKVVFLLSRQPEKDCATLISSGPWNMIHFWSVYSSGVLYSKFVATRNQSSVVTCLATDNANTRLYSADNCGFISVWNITEYCNHGPENSPPELLFFFRTHIETVTSLELIEEFNLLMTTSLDCTVRLWTCEGEYVGTFGQDEAWDIYDPDTFQHPMVPYDVLVDPMSLPNHPVLGVKQTTHEILHEDSVKAGEPKQAAPKYNRPSFYVDDATIAEQIRQKPFNRGTGKRLRHEKSKLEHVGSKNGQSEYQFLKCYDLEDTPEPSAPRLRTPKGPFDFFDD